MFRQLRIIEEIDSRKVKQQFPHLDINFMTIHQSKGLEADHVIILGVDSGSFGFPRLFGEDPLRDIFPEQIFLNLLKREEFSMLG